MVTKICTKLKNLARRVANELKQNKQQQQQQKRTEQKRTEQNKTKKRKMGYLVTFFLPLFLPKGKHYYFTVWASVWASFMS